jgi:hypothetical protein
MLIPWITATVSKVTEAKYLIIVRGAFDRIIIDNTATSVQLCAIVCEVPKNSADGRKLKTFHLEQKFKIWKVYTRMNTH